MEKSNFDQDPTMKIIMSESLKEEAVMAARRMLTGDLHESEPVPNAEGTFFLIAHPEEVSDQYQVLTTIDELPDDIRQQLEKRGKKLLLLVTTA